MCADDRPVRSACIMHAVTTMIRIPLAGFVFLVLASAAVRGQSAKQAIAHRGASGYAPEHTVVAYRLALEQKADFVEPDLAVTKDGVLVCLHDDTLERTTNIADVFPDRAMAETPGRMTMMKRWLANDFTLAEIKRLDGGRWFDPKFAGQR